LNLLEFLFKTPDAQRIKDADVFFLVPQVLAYKLSAKRGKDKRRDDVLPGLN